MTLLERQEVAPGTVGAGVPVAAALERLGCALAQLVEIVEDGGLDLLSASELVAFLQEFERVRNRLSIVDHRLIGDADQRGLPAAVAQPSMRQVLVHLLRLSPAEAYRRVAASQACGSQVSTVGEVLAPARPHLAAAQREGLLSPEHVQIIANALGKVDRAGFDPTDIEAGEQLLTEFAVTFGAKDLRRFAEQTVDAINPDGTLPDERLQQDRRLLVMRQCRDGMYAGEFRLTGPTGAKLAALLQPLSRPRVDSWDRADGSPQTLVDERTYGQRSHDALEELCDRALRAGSVTGMGGTAATVIVTLNADDLVDRVGYGTTSDGTLLTTRQVLQIAAEADVIPAVLNQSGAVLDLGRTRRVATNTQTYALVARDRGCSFPGCDRGPEWCERHHIVSWAAGGRTDLDNLTLLCRYHHHNFATRGWICRIARGLPEWHPPRWLDSAQRPLVNSRISASHAPHVRGRSTTRGRDRSEAGPWGSDKTGQWRGPPGPDQLE